MVGGLSPVSCLVSCVFFSLDDGVFCPSSSVSYLLSRFLSAVSYLSVSRVSRVSRLFSSVSCLLSRVSCLESNVSCLLMSNI